MTQNKRRSTLYTTESVSLQLQPQAAFTTIVRALHLFSKCYLLGSSLKLLSQTACSLPFTHLQQNFFCFISAQLNDLQRNGSGRSMPDFFSPCHYRRTQHKYTCCATTATLIKNMPRNGLSLNICTGRPVTCYYNFMWFL